MAVQGAREARCQPSVEGLEPGDPVGDLGAPLADHPGQLGGRVRAVPGVAPARDPGGILERQIEASQVDDQAQVLDVGRSPYSRYALSRRLARGSQPERS